MEITNELLAAYAEGNVTPEERKAVREYLTEHPSQLESVMMMMDEDYGMEIQAPSLNDFSMSLQNTCCYVPQSSLVKGFSFGRKSYSEKALKQHYHLEETLGETRYMSFNENLDVLFDDVFSRDNNN